MSNEKILTCWEKWGREYADQLMAAFHGDEVALMAYHLSLQEQYVTKGLPLFAEKQIEAARWGAELVDMCVGIGSNKIADDVAEEALDLLTAGFRKRLTEISKGQP